MDMDIESLLDADLERVASAEEEWITVLVQTSDQEMELLVSSSAPVHATIMEALGVIKADEVSMLFGGEPVHDRSTFVENGMIDGSRLSVVMVRIVSHTTHYSATHTSRRSQVGHREIFLHDLLSISANSLDHFVHVFRADAVSSVTIVTRLSQTASPEIF